LRASPDWNCPFRDRSLPGSAGRYLTERGDLFGPAIDKPPAGWQCRWES
jgi:hypothetical protein